MSLGWRGKNVIQVLNILMNARERPGLDGDNEEKGKGGQSW